MIKAFKNILNNYCEWGLICSSLPECNKKIFIRRIKKRVERSLSKHEIKWKKYFQFDMNLIYLFSCKLAFENKISEKNDQMFREQFDSLFVIFLLNVIVSLIKYIINVRIHLNSIDLYTRDNN